MIITGSQFRAFYPQESLSFDFSVSNYSSNDFEIGITGNSYVYFKFKNGLIKDNFSNVIGTYNKDIVNINGSIKDGKYNYYLNSIPIARDLSIPNATSIFSALVAKILDAPSTNSLNLQASVKGENIPSLEFINFYSSGATSGIIVNNNEYPIDIFSLSSYSISGDWFYEKVLNPWSTSPFYNYSVTGLEDNFPVSLNIETNFGNNIYNLRVLNKDSSGSATEPEDFERDWLDINYFKIDGFSGDSELTGNYKVVYELLYYFSKGDLDNGTVLNSLNLSLNYTQGKTGNLILQDIKENANIYFSGILPATLGIASGELYSTDYSFIWEDYSIPYNFPKDINFYQENPILTQYFSNLYATGEVSYSISSEDTSLFKFIKDSDLTSSNGYFMDLGGKTGLFPESISILDNELSYNRINSYKGYIFTNSSTDLTVTKIVEEKDQGKYLFGNVSFPAPSSVLQSFFSYPNDVIYNIPAKEIFPYKGVAFASLKDTNLVLKGDREGSFIPYLFLNESSDVLFFKNLPNIDYKGKYTIYKTQSNENVIKGRVVLEDSPDYYKTGVYFSLDEGIIYDGKSFINSIFSQSLQQYRNIDPFEILENPKSTLFKNNTRLKGPDMSWGENNFLALKKAKENGLLVFKSNSEDITFGIKLIDQNFVKTTTETYIEESINLAQPIAIFDLTSSQTLNTYNFDGLVNFKFDRYSVAQDNLFRDARIETSFFKEYNTDYLLSFYWRPNNADSIQSFLYWVQVWEVEKNIKGSNTQNWINLRGKKTDGGSANVSYTTVDENGNTYPDFIARVDIVLPRNESFSEYKKIIFKLANTPLEPYEGMEETALFSAMSNVCYFDIFGIQIEKYTTNGKPSLYIPRSQSTIIERISTDTIANDAYFTFFIYKLYGINGKFYLSNSIGRKYYLPDNIEDRESKRKTCNDIIGSSCFSMYKNNLPVENNIDYVYNYKGKPFKESNIYKFFNEKIKTHLADYPLLYTDFEKLYLQVGENKYIFQKNNEIYGEGITEIINLFVKFKNFSYTTVVLNQKSYSVPIPGGETVYLPIEDSEISDIIFSGYLNKNLDLNIQAGYGRYYPYEDNLNSKSFGYFYETDNFFDIKNENTNIIASNNNIVPFFPANKDFINTKVSKTVNFTNQNFYRLIKNNNITFNKNINETVYVPSCYFRIEKQIPSVNVTGTFYNASKNMAQVWSLKINDSPLNTSNNIYSSPDRVSAVTTGYIVPNFALKKDGNENYLYIEIEHKDLEYINLGQDKAILDIRMDIDGEPSQDASLTIG
jgi:hypothetical protein